MSTGGRELVASDEATLITKPPLDTIVVEDSEGDRGLSNSARADESDWSEVRSEIDYLLDQLIVSKEGPRWQRRRFSRYANFKCETMGPLAVWIPDLVLAQATVSGYSVMARLRVSLTNRSLPSPPS